MPWEIETEQLIYLLIPVIVIILGIYFLIIHKRRCPYCGRPIRPMWRECSCASGPATVFSPVPEEGQEIGSTADIGPDISPDRRAFSNDQKPKEKREIGSIADITPFSFDDAQPLSETGMGTEVMLPTAPQAWLLIEEWEMPEKRYEMKATATSIGSSDDNDIVLKNKAVSRHHAKIRIEGKKYFIYDLASTNGTKVNGRKITKKWIKEGDSIEMGHTRMTFKLDAMPEHKPSNLLKM